MKTYKATIRDVNEIVQIHKSAFPNFFLTTLGKSFLYTYYKAFVSTNEGLVLCTKDDNNNVIAFAATAYISKGFNKHLLKENFLSFFVQFVWLLIVSPKSIIRLIKNLKKTSVDIDDDGLYAELFSIAVKRDCQGNGLGEFLLGVLEEKLLDKNIRILSLTTDVCNNNATLAFYRKMGFGIYYKFISYPNRPMYRLIKKINL